VGVWVRNLVIDPTQEFESLDDGVADALSLLVAGAGCAADGRNLVRSHVVTDHDADPLPGAHIEQPLRLGAEQASHPRWRTIARRLSIGLDVMHPVDVDEPDGGPGEHGERPDLLLRRLQRPVRGPSSFDESMDDAAILKDADSGQEGAMILALTRCGATDRDDPQGAVDVLQNGMAHEVPGISQVIRDQGRSEEHGRRPEHPANEEAVDERLMIRDDQEFRLEPESPSEADGPIEEAEDEP